MNEPVLNKEEQIRQEVIQTARELFQQYGFYKTTIEDIARAMKKGKSTLYYYYKSKDEIFEAVVTNEITGVFNEIRDAVEKCHSAEEKLRIYFLTAVHSIHDKILLYRILKKEMGENLKTIVALRYKMDLKEVLFIKEILKYGLKTKEFVTSIEKDIDLMAFAIVSALRSITLDLVVENRFPNWDKRITVLSDIFIRGLKK